MERIVNNSDLIIINVEDVVRFTEVQKVIRCYDLKKWEEEELLSLKNTTDKSLNEFRWDYLKGTLELTNDMFDDIGILVRDLIDDIKMGYHRIPSEFINMDVEDKDICNIYNDAQVMNFEYEPLRDFQSRKITRIVIHYSGINIDKSIKLEETNELLTYLNLNCLYKESLAVAN